jgi:hypothetical protein
MMFRCGSFSNIAACPLSRQLFSAADNRVLRNGRAAWTAGRPCGCRARG